MQDKIKEEIITAIESLHRRIKQLETKSSLVWNILSTNLRKMTHTYYPKTKEDIMKEKEQSTRIQAIHNSIRNNPETLSLTEAQIRRLINLKLIAAGLPAQFQIDE